MGRATGAGQQGGGFFDWVKETYSGKNAGGNGDTSAFTQVDAMGNQTGVAPDTPAPAKKDPPPAAKKDTKPSNVKKGKAEPASDPPKATADPAVETPAASYKMATIPNPLLSYASVTPLWTMACLTPDQFNNPSTYRYNDSALENVVFAEAGYLDSARTKTAYGSPEYFVNNFEMTGLIVPAGAESGTGNSINFHWQLYEPLSMGLFLQSLQASALNAGYANYLNSATYVLKLDFVGWDENGANKVIPGLTRYFPIKLVSVNFNVNETGSVYDVTAIPYNHSGYSNIVDVLTQDYVLKGSSVKEILVDGANSLAVALTKESARLAKTASGVGVPDVYLITFPSSEEVAASPAQANNVRGATVTPGASTTSIGTSTGNSDFGDNPIGQASMGFDMTSGGTPVTPNDVDVYVDGYVDKTKVTINPKARTFSFGQKQRITDVITEIVIASDYARKAIKGEPDADGLINWFKVDVQVQLKEFDVVRNDFAKVINYRVIPYKVHHTLLKKPTAAAKGYDSLVNKITKRYDYLYTGKNNDILKFDLTFKAAFFTAIQPAPLEDGASKDPATNTGADSKIPKVVVGAGKDTGALVSQMGTPRVIPSIDGTIYKPGGAKADDIAVAVARDFHHAFLNSSVDLLSIELEILGDPYFVADSGLGNYFATPRTDGTTDDGAMAYEGGTVFIYLAFRTPTDVQVGGPLYDFPNRGKLSPFSGIYRVIKVNSKFTDGVFKQTINAIRMPGQPEDRTDNGAGGGGESGALTFAGELEAADLAMSDRPEAAQ